MKMKCGKHGEQECHETAHGDFMCEMCHLETLKQFQDKISLPTYKLIATGSQKAGDRLQKALDAFKEHGTVEESAVRKVTYCSFAVKDGCLGVCILDGELNAVQAAVATHSLGINPGDGELFVVSCKETDEDVPQEIFQAMWDNRNRLITPDDARALFDAQSLKELDEASLQGSQNTSEDPV